MPKLTLAGINKAIQNQEKKLSNKNKTYQATPMDWAQAIGMKDVKVPRNQKEAISLQNTVNDKLYEAYQDDEKTDANYKLYESLRESFYDSLVNMMGEKMKGGGAKHNEALNAESAKTGIIGFFKRLFSWFGNSNKKVSTVFPAAYNQNNNSVVSVELDGVERERDAVNKTSKVGKKSVRFDDNVKVLEIDREGEGEKLPPAASTTITPISGERMSEYLAKKKSDSEVHAARNPILATEPNLETAPGLQPGGLKTAQIRAQRLARSEQNNKTFVR